MAYDFFESTSNMSASSSSGLAPSQPRIPGYENNAIVKLTAEHSQALGDKLRAVVVFGPLLSDNGSLNIDMLEVVDDWDGPGAVSFASTNELPLRGDLTIYFVKRQDIEDPHGIEDASHKNWLIDILDEVRKAYMVVVDYPMGYFSQQLRNLEKENRHVIHNEGSPLSFVNANVETVLKGHGR
ncbi:MAG TPA: hypothetical protein VGK19_11805 [Capsulimonadaceae bacterium]|jgi:hypothetical protein